MTRILIVDDEPQIRRALGINLRARGYDVESAADGETDADPELSEWSPVAKSGRGRGRGAKTSSVKNAKDASWWDAALSSGDAETEVDVED